MMSGGTGPHVIEPAGPARSVSIRLWEQDGAWEWDIRWPGPPQMRSTGSRPTLREALAEVTSDVLVVT